MIFPIVGFTKLEKPESEPSDHRKDKECNSKTDSYDCTNTQRIVCWVFSYACCWVAQWSRDGAWAWTSWFYSWTSCRRRGGWNEIDNCHRLPKKLIWRWSLESCIRRRWTRPVTFIAACPQIVGDIVFYTCTIPSIASLLTHRVL